MVNKKQNKKTTTKNKQKTNKKQKNPNKKTKKQKNKKTKKQKNKKTKPYPTFQILGPFFFVGFLGCKKIIYSFYVL